MAAVGKPRAGGLAAAAGDLADLHTAAQVDPVVLVQVGEDLRDLAAEHPQQRQVGHLQHGDLGTGRARSGRGFQPDPAGTDHRDPGRALEGRPDPVAVPGAAQVENAIEIGSRQR